MSKDKSRYKRSHEGRMSDVNLDAAVGGWTQMFTRSIETGRSGTARSGGELEELDFEKTLGY